MRGARDARIVSFKTHAPLHALGTFLLISLYLFSVSNFACCVDINCDVIWLLFFFDSPFIFEGFLQSRSGVLLVVKWQEML